LLVNNRPGHLYVSIQTNSVGTETGVRRKLDWNTNESLLLFLVGFCTWRLLGPRLEISRQLDKLSTEYEVVQTER